MVNRMSRIVVAPGARLAGRAGAFTLVELVVTVALIAILAAAAYPAYVSQMIKGNRSAA
jgi:type IV pilus assembly protein PilE